MSPNSPSTSPLVSIIMPTWNRAELIGKSIQSVIDQSHTHWELMIMDDGSTDQTEEIVSSYKDSRIHYKYLEHSGRIASIRSAGFDIACGELIAFHDSDDLWLPKKLALQLKYLEKHPKADYIITNGFHFGESFKDPVNLELFFEGNLFLPMLLEERFIYFVPSLLIRKEAIKKIQSTPATDLTFFLSLAHCTRGIFTNERLVKIRKHHESDSRVNPEKAFHDFLQMLDMFLADKKITAAQYRHLRIREFYKLGLLHIQQQSWTKALEVLRQVSEINPFHFKSWIRRLQVLWESRGTHPLRITSSTPQ